MSACGLVDPGPITKRDRLFTGLRDGQAREGSGTDVAKLLERAMDPVRCRGDRSLFDEDATIWNQILAFAAMHMRVDGELETVRPATTLA